MFSMSLSLSSTRVQCTNIYDLCNIQTSVVR